MKMKVLGLSFCIALALHYLCSMKEKLLQAIEQRTGLRMQCHRDFIELNQLIFNELHENISISTLKRLWGYVNPLYTHTRQGILNILAQFVGCYNYEHFVKITGDDKISSQTKEVSCFSFAPFFIAKELGRGEQIAARWEPNRYCVMKHLNGNKFKVIECKNCKLNVGDTFYCDSFLEGETMHVYNLTHLGKSGLSYVAGKHNGVKYELLKNCQD